MSPEIPHTALQKAAFAGVIACALLAAGCTGDSSPLPLVGTLERERMELVAEFQETIVELNVTKGSGCRPGSY